MWNDDLHFYYCPGPFGAIFKVGFHLIYIKFSITMHCVYCYLVLPHPHPPINTLL